MLSEKCAKSIDIFGRMLYNKIKSFQMQGNAANFPADEVRACFKSGDSRISGQFFVQTTHGIRRNTVCIAGVPCMVSVERRLLEDNKQAL